MKKYLISLLLYCLATSVSTAERLIATDQRVSDLRKAIASRSEHHVQAFKNMVERVGKKNLRKAYPSGLGKYEEGYRAREAALLALISDGSDQRRYAQLAYDMASKVAKRENGSVTGMYRDPNGMGLGAAMNGMNLAFVYNWMRDLWTEKQNSQIRSKIEEALNDWPKFKHANTSQNHDASNWVAVTRGAELIMIYTIGDQEKRSDRLDFISNRLVNHLKNGFGDHGANQEGMGYIEYPGIFLIPAALIDRENGPGKLWQKLQEHAFWKLAMYTHSFQPKNFENGDRKFLLWGVAARGADQGWASLLFPTVPEQNLPHYLWWYDAM